MFFALLLGTAGCTSRMLLQTAHTVPPAGVRGALGVSSVHNELSGERGEAGGAEIFSLSGEPSARVGLTSSLDIGAAPLLSKGGALDAKLNLIRPEAPFALAPRLRLGFAVPGDDRLFLAEAGVVVSHRLWTVLEPYAGLGFANHWITRPLTTADLEPNQSLAERSGAGDGLVKLHAGLSLGSQGGFAGLLEYGFWKTAQNDPGDGFRFVDNHVASLGFCYEGGH